MTSNKKTHSPCHIYIDPSVFCSRIKKWRWHKSSALKKTILWKEKNFASKRKKEQRHAHFLTVSVWIIWWIWIRMSFQNTCNVMHIRHTSSTWCTFQNKPYVTVFWSDNWFELMRALLDSPSSSLSLFVHVKVQHTNTGSLSPFQCWSMSPCLFAPVQAWWRVVSVEILKSPWLFYPMVMPKPHWNLFLRWLRKAPKANDRGRGTSFFSSVAPTTQLLSKEPLKSRFALGTSNW